MLSSALLLPPEAFAEPATARTPILDAARAAARRHAAALTSRDAAQVPQPAPASAPDTDLRSGSFFRSKAGMATLVVFAAGVGYAIYSSSNDRIRSAGR